MSKIAYNMSGDSMDGFLFINKPKGMTSHDVVYRVKKQLKIQKIGHTGTLDPFATGLLILCLGKATKLSDYITQQDKSYEGTILFGTHTDTFDITGNILNKVDVGLLEKDILNGMRHFTTTYDQRPPNYSAIKVDGQKSYDMARKGATFTLETRSVSIYDFKAISPYEDQHIDFYVHVSKGTYIRSLVVDLAKHLGTIATLNTLKRTSIGAYSLDLAKDLSHVTEEDIYPLETYLERYEKLILSPYLIHLVKNGIYLDARQIKTDQPFVVYDEEGHMIAFYDVCGNHTYKPVLIL
ncbi:MAG: tRNA pseudouridine(55) synthase TruB [Acholeplasmataceae bacterium]